MTTQSRMGHRAAGWIFRAAALSTGLTWADAAPDPAWIGSADPSIRSPLARRDFEVRPNLRSATLSATAIGYVEVYLNGTRVGDEVLAPAPTQVETRVLVSTHDVTSMLRPGGNAAGLWLAEGQAAITHDRPDRFCNVVREIPGPYPAPAGWMRLDLTYGDGSKDVIVTDGAWTTSASPLTFAHFYGGEDYDTRLEQPGWNEPGFTDDAWTPAEIRHDIRVRLTPRDMPPMRVVDRIQPVARRALGGGVTLFDLGQNIGGWWRIRVRGRPGAIMSVRGAETLDNRIFPGGFDEAGGISTGFTHGRGGHYERDAVTRFILRGGDEEVYEPRFFYTGFRYAQVEGSDSTALQSVELEGCAVHTDVARLGNFRCSDERLNRLYENTVWSIKGILQGAPMSNPNSEKYGWTGDAHLFTEAANAIFDMDALWRKWLMDLRDAQDAHGGGRFIPSTVPNYRTDRNPTTAAWGAAYPLAAWYLYRYTGDASVYRDYFEPIRTWADEVAATAKDGLVGGIWADHVAPAIPPTGRRKSIAATPNLRPIAGTAYWIATDRVVAEMARALGRDAEAGKHEARARQASDALNARFLDRESGLYRVKPDDAAHHPLQTANLIPLQFGLVPEAFRDRVLDHVLRDIRETHGTHLTTGILGTKALIEVLIRERQGALLFDLATQPTYPGWGFWLANGATTHWQHWDGDPDHNHAMFGSIAEFLTHGIAGLVPPTEPETTPGWTSIRISPQFIPQLDWAEASVPTPRGLARCRWERTPSGIRLDIDVPVGATAEIRLPAAEAGAIDPAPGATVALPLASGRHELIVEGGRISKAAAGQTP